jgi:2-polyprenyl-3-methyl-5-hydroxy-6-metoxy-1,4-benzoquinol methylase
MLSHPRKLVHRTMKRFFRSLGYEIVWHRRQGQDTRDGTRYVAEFSPRHVFDYFYAWESQFVVDGKRLGGSTNYETQRVSMLNVPELRAHVDFGGKNVLELGPLEGGNTFLLTKLGVARVTAVEARVENYVKCCVIKNLFGLDNARFLLGDAREVSVETHGRFDFALVAGVLYHLDDPHKLLQRLSGLTDTLLISTHYADDRSPSQQAKVLTLSTPDGEYRGKLFPEGELSEINSGIQSWSFWPFEEDLMRMLADTGYRNVSVLRKNPIPEEPYRLIYLVAKK